MRNKYSVQVSLVLFLLFSYSVGTVYAQQVLTVGEIRNNLPVVTQTANAIQALKAGLSSTAVISEVEIQWVGGEENKYFLIGRVSNDPISAKAIELKKENNTLRAVAGPGLEIECKGIDCSGCRLAIRNWKLVCLCSQSPNPDGFCEMSFRLVVTL